ncbi:hypothetical protein [Aliamphritea ceti]|uniref:hypothetical protein n=1 Tax=Aliamphritea ceti TaxID=1524258 RepID=UPI0021C4AE15|nr:hypothetical protein [Aliamphritea ceti]
MPNITGGAATAGDAKSGDSRNGGTMFNNGGLTINRNNPWVMVALVAAAVVVFLWLTRRKKK